MQGDTHGTTSESERSFPVLEPRKGPLGPDATLCGPGTLRCSSRTRETFYTTLHVRISHPGIWRSWGGRFRLDPGSPLARGGRGEGLAPLPSWCTASLLLLPRISVWEMQCHSKRLTRYLSGWPGVARLRCNTRSVQQPVSEAPRYGSQRERN
jgi:hypothetical protein